MLDRDKRNWERVAVDMPAKVRRARGRARYAPVRIVNMHHQGCCLQSPQGFLRDDVLRIMIDIPFEGPVTMTGRVVWSGVGKDADGSLTGISFLADGPGADDVCLKLYHFCQMRGARP